MNEKVNPFKKLQKPGKHVKRIVIGAAGLVIIAGLAGDATYQMQILLERYAYSEIGGTFILI